MCWQGLETNLNTSTTTRNMDIMAVDTEVVMWPTVLEISSGCKENAKVQTKVQKCLLSLSKSKDLYCYAFQSQEKNTAGNKNGIKAKTELLEIKVTIILTHPINWNQWHRWNQTIMYSHWKQFLRRLWFILIISWKIVLLMLRRSPKYQRQNLSWKTLNCS